MNGSIIFYLLYTIGSLKFQTVPRTTASTLRTSFAKREEGLSNVLYLRYLSTFAWYADGQYNNID